MNCYEVIINRQPRGMVNAISFHTAAYRALSLLEIDQTREGLKMPNTVQLDLTFKWKIKSVTKSGISQEQEHKEEIKVSAPVCQRTKSIEGEA